MSQHTPGPWKFVTGNRDELTGRDGERVIRLINGDNLLCSFERKIHIEICEADKKLIEAAPDTLAALKMCLDFCQGQAGSYAHDCVITAQAAIDMTKTES